MSHAMSFLQRGTTSGKVGQGKVVPPSADKKKSRKRNPPLPPLLFPPPSIIACWRREVGEEEEKMRIFLFLPSVFLFVPFSAAATQKVSGGRKGRRRGWDRLAGAASKPSFPLVPSCCLLFPALPPPLSSGPEPAWPGPARPDRGGKKRKGGTGATTNPPLGRSESVVN